MDPMLSHLVSLLPQSGLKLTEVSSDQSFLDCEDTASSLKVLIGIGPGPSVLMTALLPAPPLADDELETTAARLQMRVPHARLQLRRTPNGNVVAFLDDAHMFDPRGAPLDAAWVRGGVDALVHAGRALELLQPALEDSAALLSSFSKDDDQKQRRVRQLFEEQGLVLEDEAGVLGGDALLVKNAEDGPPTRVMVRDNTLLFHVAIPLEAPPDVRAHVATTVHKRLPFGRILLGALDGANAIVEYPYRLRAGHEEIREYDALHGFEVLGAISDVLIEMFGDDDEELDDSDDGEHGPQA